MDLESSFHPFLLLAIVRKYEVLSPCTYVLAVEGGFCH
jgi:hypothetical protein